MSDPPYIDGPFFLSLPLDIRAAPGSARCEAAADAAKADEARAERKLEEVGELHARELKRERDAWAAAEKIRREQWMAKVRNADF